MNEIRDRAFQICRYQARWIDEGRKLTISWAYAATEEIYGDSTIKQMKRNSLSFIVLFNGVFVHMWSFSMSVHISTMMSKIITSILLNNHYR